MTNKNGQQPHLNGNGNGLVRVDPPSQAPAADAVDPEILAEVWAKRARAYAAPLPIEATGDSFDLLVFSLHGERYGIKVDFVRAIYPLQKFTPVPRTPDFVIGIFSARGRLISIIDLWAFFGLGRIALSESTKIVIVYDELSAMEVGFVANDVEDVVTVYEADLASGLVTQTHSLAEFIQGIAPEMLAVLDVAALLNSGQLIVNQDRD